MPHINLGGHKLGVLHTVMSQLKYKMPHLDPPEKGRKAWLCVLEPGAKREGSNTCRQSTRAKTGRSHPSFQSMRTQDSQR